MTAIGANASSETQWRIIGSALANLARPNPGRDGTGAYTGKGEKFVAVGARAGKGRLYTAPMRCCTSPGTL